MNSRSILQTYQRYRTLQSDIIHALPIVMLMPHSACNCQCVMCDIWKGNRNLKQLEKEDIARLLQSFRRLRVQQVVMTGGEALLNPNFFRFCEMIREQGIRVSLLSTGLTIKKHAESIVSLVNDVIVSLDGDQPTHDAIRNIPGAYLKLSEGVRALHILDSGYTVRGRSVIHRLNFRKWPEIVDCAAAIGLKQISFLPADVSSHAFNREILWGKEKKEQIMLAEDELAPLQETIDLLRMQYAPAFENRFIAESPEKIQKIHSYYAAFYGHNPFPFKRCNAPWVSTVIEADGTVRPCFFHPPIGNIHEHSLPEILNAASSVEFRKQLDISANPTCEKCVCYLNLSPRSRI
jgi:MoaA/NifB/PqqE/SkfB family radical SAM enzyme